jgi:hypothetical protein
MKLWLCTMIFAVFLFECSPAWATDPPSNGIGDCNGDREVTVDTYGHLVPGGNQAAVNRLDDPEDATGRHPDATQTGNIVPGDRASA